jgi:hypothetical protein
MTESEIKIEELRLGVIKSTATFYLAAAGGILTISKAFFEDGYSLRIALFSVASLVIASMLMLSISESTIRRISKQPTSKFFIKLNRTFSCSINSEFYRSALSGVFAGIGLGLFIFFLVVNI